MYVMDTEAILTVPRLVTASQLNRLLDEFVPRIEDGLICVPDAVIAECRRIAAGEVIATWLHAVSGSRKHKSIPYTHTIKVLGKCSALLDEDAESDMECSPVSVAALADYLSQCNPESPYVVSEDRVNLPTRLSLVTACGVLGFPVMDTIGLVYALGLSSYLLP